VGSDEGAGMIVVSRADSFSSSDNETAAQGIEVSL
jgi:hypothetical protein